MGSLLSRDDQPAALPPHPSRGWTGQGVLSSAPGTVDSVWDADDSSEPLLGAEQSVAAQVIENDLDEEDYAAAVCPAMLYSCLPCCGCEAEENQRRRSNRYPPNTLAPPLESDLPKDILVITIHLDAVRGLLAGEGIRARDLNVYIQFRVYPLQEGVGEQEQRSRPISGTLSPKWDPPQAFQFFVTDPQRALVQATVWDRSEDGDLRSLGQGFLEVKKLAASFDVKGPVLRRVEVLVRDTGHHSRTFGATSGLLVSSEKPLDAMVLCRAFCQRVDQAYGSRDDRMYEYERFVPVLKWGSSRPGHLTPQDPGKWSNLEGTRFAMNFMELAPPVPHKKTVILPWCPFEGWEYSSRFNPRAVWSEKRSPGMDVRRRVWRRVCRGAVEFSLSPPPY